VVHSPKCSLENPEKNVKQKSRVNREILKGAWDMLQQLIGEKGKSATRMIVKADQKNTSRGCSSCERHPGT
jgi:transposase